jgi:hypothetical protein
VKTPPRWLDLASLVALFTALLLATWRRWPDPLVDFWRNLYIPWRVSEGALLYEQVADWYGPLPSLVMAAGFRLFGPGLPVLLALNGAVALACVVTLRAALERVGDRLSAWTGAACFVLVFCFGQYAVLGNYNFMTPYVSQATWGFFGVLLALLGTLECRDEDSARGWFAVGAGLSVAWLTKAEAALAVLVLLAALVGMRRRVPPRAFLAGLATVGVPVALLLSLQGGVAYAFEAFHHAVAFTLSPGARATIASVPIFTTDLGLEAPLQNVLAHLGPGALFLAALAVLARGTSSKPQLALSGVLIVALLVAPDPLMLGRALLLPTVVVAFAATIAALRGKTAWRGLAFLGLAALAMLARMGLHVRLYHYGFTMAVLATALAVHLLVFEAPRWSGVTHAGPRFLAVLLVLGSSARLTWHSLETYAAKTTLVGEGRDAVFAFPPEVHRNTQVVTEVLDALARHAPNARTLVAFPDGGAIGYRARIHSPIPQFEFNPVSLGFAGEERILVSLQAAPPDVVVLTSYDLRSHGSAFFGGTPASGQALATWVKANYRIVASGPKAPFSVTGHAWDVLVRRAP